MLRERRVESPSVARRTTAAAALTLLATIAITSLIAGNAPAQLNFQTPSDNELHSAYCGSVLKAQIAWLQPELVKALGGLGALMARFRRRQLTA
jgi:hypothetical protein